MTEVFRLEAVTVNHNTSLYAELMMRSLFTTHPNLDFTLTVFDNTSVDDTTKLEAYTRGQNTIFIPSGFSTETKNNSHGEILRRFVLEHPHASHYLFLDSDVCFSQPNTLNVMLAELEAAPDAFGIGPRMSWDGVDEIPRGAREANPDIQDARLHPCCALVKNTPLFRRVVEEVGLSGVTYLWAERDEHLDTFKLTTKVMRTHGLRHIISSAMIVHFFAVSYTFYGETYLRHKAELRDKLLNRYHHL